jgi:hypothetical protein
VRRGTSVVASHRSSDSAPWIEVPVRLRKPFDVGFAFGLSNISRTSFRGEKVRVAINNFHLSAAQLICR